MRHFFRLISSPVYAAYFRIDISLPPLFRRHDYAFFDDAMDATPLPRADVFAA